MHCAVDSQKLHINDDNNTVAVDLILWTAFCAISAAFSCLPSPTSNFTSYCRNYCTQRLVILHAPVANFTFLRGGSNQSKERLIYKKGRQ